MTVGKALSFRIVLWSVLTVWIAASAQLPPDEKLSAADQQAMTQELERLRDLLKTANDPGAVEFQIARTYAAGGQYREAMDWLTTVVHARLGFDPSRDKLFMPLNKTKEFQALLEQARTDTPPVSHSHLAAILPEENLFPENLVFDPVTKSFFLGNTLQDEIVRCSEQGSCESFAGSRERGLVLGLKIHQPSRTLWTTFNAEDGASLRQYSLDSGRLIRSYGLKGAHLFNDLAVSTQGEVFVTDTKEGSVYRVSRSRGRMEKVAPGHTFTSANGIALSPDERTLFVASFGDGIAAVDLDSETVRPMRHPASVCLAYIDGLYSTKEGLIAIQNGPMVPRVVRFALSSGGRGIMGMTVLERGNPLFEGITTGVLVGNQFYYVANSQIDDVVDGRIRAGVKVKPLRILRLEIRP